MSKPRRSGAITTVYMRMTRAHMSHETLNVPVASSRYHGITALDFFLLLTARVAAAVFATATAADGGECDPAGAVLVMLATWAGMS